MTTDGAALKNSFLGNLLGSADEDRPTDVPSSTPGHDVYQIVPAFGGGTELLHEIFVVASSIQDVANDLTKAVLDAADARGFPDAVFILGSDKASAKSIRKHLYSSSEAIQGQHIISL